jgi:hypothetical protein
MEGALCGPPDRPCKVLEDEILPGALAYRSDAPSIALDVECTPHVLLSAATDTYQGYYAKRIGPSSWTSELTPFMMAAGALFIDSQGTRFAVPNDGAFGASLWARADDEWIHLQDVPDKVTHWARGVAQSTTGAIYLGFTASEGEIKLGKYTNGWDLLTLEGWPSSPAVALSPTDTVYVLALALSNTSWSFSLYSPPSGPELVGTFGLGPFTFGAPVIRVTAAGAGNPEGKPHILAEGSDGKNVQLVYITKDGAGSWTGSTLENAPSDVRIKPLGIVSEAGGGVRRIYTKQSGLNEEEIRMHWIEAGGQSGTVSLASSTSVEGCTLVRDGLGGIQMALYQSVNGGGSEVRYLRLGPPS